MFIFNQKGELQVREVSERPEVVVQTINCGDWERYLPYEPSPTQAWQAVRVNRLVVVTPLTMADEYPRSNLLPENFKPCKGCVQVKMPRKSAISSISRRVRYTATSTACALSSNPAPFPSC